MHQLDEYCMEVRCINGLDTYIISPLNYDALILDTELIEGLGFTNDWSKKRINAIVEICRRGSVLYPAFVWHRDRSKTKICEWEPIYCYRQDDIFYHVMYRESWRCVACGCQLQAPLIMPMVEHDPLFYTGTENRWPDTPPIFQKAKCPKCGMMLNNYLMFL